MTEDGIVTQVDQVQLVVFTLANEAYGVEIASVREIIRMQSITRVPKTPEYVEGVIDLRGKVIPVVDLRRRFGFDGCEHSKETRILVVDIDGQEVGMVVDAVTEVLRVPADSVEPPTSVITSDDSDYLMGIVKLEARLIILLNLSKVLALNEKTSLSNMVIGEDVNEEAVTTAG